MKWFSKLFRQKISLTDVADINLIGDDVFLFYDETKHYHAWLTNDNKRYVWPKVKHATQTDDRLRTDLTLISDDTYTFIEQHKTAEIPPYDPRKSIELYYNKNIVSSFDLVLLNEDYQLHWVEFIKDGEWTKDIAEFLVWEKEKRKMMDRNIRAFMEEARRNKMNKTLDD
jgi:hypothetical protein